MGSAQQVGYGIALMSDTRIHWITYLVGGIASGAIFTARKDPDTSAKFRNTFDCLLGPE